MSRVADPLFGRFAPRGREAESRQWAQRRCRRREPRSRCPCGSGEHQRASCQWSRTLPAIGQPKAAPQYGASDLLGGKVHVRPARSIFSHVLNLPLRNRGLGPLAVTVLPIPLARRATATSLRRRAIDSGPFSRTAISPYCCPDGIMFARNRRVGLTSGLVDL